MENLKTDGQFVYKPTKAMSKERALEVLNLKPKQLYSLLEQEKFDEVSEICNKISARKSYVITSYPIKKYSNTLYLAILEHFLWHKIFQTIILYNELIRFTVRYIHISRIYCNF